MAVVGCLLPNTISDALELVGGLAGFERAGGFKQLTHRRWPGAVLGLGHLDFDADVVLWVFTPLAQGLHRIFQLALVVLDLFGQVGDHGVIPFDQSNRADVMVTFAEPRDQRALFELQRAPGVWRAEPMRMIGAKLDGERRSKSEALTAAISGSDLNRIVSIDGAIIEAPPRGVLVSYGLSNELGLAIGDSLDVQITEGRRDHFALPVVGIIKSAVGSPAYVDADMIAARLKEPPLLSGAYLGVDPGRIDELYRYLKMTPLIAGVSLRAASRSGLEETIGETMGIVTLFNTGFSALIVFGVIYNNARISLAERSRDLASLRVLGYRRSEVSYILLGELAILTMVGLPFGVAFGYYLSRWLSSALGGDLFIVPFGLTAGTVAQAVLLVLLAATITALFVRRRLDRLDLVAVLKIWD